MPAVKVIAALAVGAVAFTAGCVHHQGFTVPSAAKTLALFRQDLAAAQRHDEHALCATAEYSDQCQQDLAARPFPRLTDVRAASVSVVDENRVIRVCGNANGKPFASDFAVTQDPSGHLGAVNPVFWTPIQFVPEPSQGAPVSATPLSSPTGAVC